MSLLTCSPVSSSHTFFSHLSVVVHLCLPGGLFSCSPHGPRCPAPPPSDESDYHTDYEEEALESALSDLELSYHTGDHTEGEETADTVGSHLTASEALTARPFFCVLLLSPVEHLSEKTPV